jgi:putative oxidoreductase
VDGLALMGRLLYSAVFLLSAPQHFRKDRVTMAQRENVPAPQAVVPLSGLLALAGALSIAMGYKARRGAWIIAAFLAPVTLMMHRFWRESDPGTREIQQIQFFKNLSLLGGALLLAGLGPGRLSLDAEDSAARSNARGARNIRTTPETPAASEGLALTVDQPSGLAGLPVSGS